MTLSASGSHKSKKHCFTWEKHFVCSNCETYPSISTTKRNSSADNRVFFCPDCAETLPQSIYQNTHNVKNATKVQDALGLAIQASDVCLEVLRLDSGKTKLEGNNIKFYDMGLFFTISFLKSHFINGLIDTLDPENKFQMRSTSLIFLELGAPNNNGLYKAGLLHLVFGNAGPDGKRIEGKPGKLRDNMGNEQAIGNGRDFEKYFGIDYNAPGAWEAIADSILAIITTWSVYGYNQNEREDKRVGLNLGFTTKLKNNDIFASVIIGSNGFIVTVHIDDSPIKKLQCAFDDQTIPKERFSVKCKFCSNIYTTNNRLKNT